MATETRRWPSAVEADVRPTRLAGLFHFNARSRSLVSFCGCRVYSPPRSACPSYPDPLISWWPCDALPVNREKPHSPTNTRMPLPREPRLVVSSDPAACVSRITERQRNDQGDGHLLGGRSAGSVAWLSRSWRSQLPLSLCSRPMRSFGVLRYSPTGRRPSAGTGDDRRPRPRSDDDRLSLSPLTASTFITDRVSGVPRASIRVFSNGARQDVVRRSARQSRGL